MRLASIKRLTLGALACSIAFAASISAQQQAPRVQQQRTAFAQQKTTTAAVQQKQVKAADPVAALQVVPDGVMGFAVLRNLGELDTKLNALAKDLQIPAPPALMTIRQLIGIGLFGIAVSFALGLFFASCFC